jgi:hypothetical protein
MDQSPCDAESRDRGYQPEARRASRSDTRLQPELHAGIALHGILVTGDRVATTNRKKGDRLSTIALPQA